MIKAIILDCFGVLYVHQDTSLKDYILANQPELRDQLHDIGRQSDYGLISHKDYIEQIAALAGMTYEEALTHISDGSQINKLLLDYAQSLRKTYKLGMLSNISAESMNSYFTQADRSKYFDDVVISSEVGMVKPHPEIFELASKRLGADPSEVIMVDDIAENLDGARSVGMHTILYEDFASTRQQIEEIIKTQFVS